MADGANKIPARLVRGYPIILSEIHFVLFDLFFRTLVVVVFFLGVFLLLLSYPARWQFDLPTLINWRFLFYFSLQHSLWPHNM